MVRCCQVIILDKARPESTSVELELREPQESFVPACVQLKVVVGRFF
jgi:hypothetical protein